MESSVQNKFGFFTTLFILLGIVIFIYLIHISPADYRKIFIIGLFQIYIGSVCAIGVIHPHKSIFYRIFPIVVGFFLYPFFGDAVPQYIAGMAIVAGFVFLVFGMLGYFGAFYIY